MRCCDPPMPYMQFTITVVSLQHFCDTLWRTVVTIGDFSGEKVTQTSKPTATMAITTTTKLFKSQFLPDRKSVV